MADEQGSAENLDKRTRPETIGLREFAERMGLSYGYLSILARQGKLPIAPIRFGRSYRFPVAAVDSLLGVSMPDDQ